nr:Wzy [Plesiomonas shigelloides]
MIDVLVCIYFIFLLKRFFFNGIDHFTLFLFGGFYYFIVPIIVGEYWSVFGMDYFKQWFSIYESLSYDNKLLFVIYVFLLVFLYKLGSVIYSCVFCEGNEVLTSRFLVERSGLSELSGKYIFLVILLVSSFIWWISRRYFFSGYSDGYNASLMGKMATLELLILVVFLLMKNKRKIVGKCLFILLMLNGVLLLSMGGRMYVLLSGIFLFLFFSYGRKMTIRVWGWGCVCSLILIFVGVVRADSFSFDKLLYIALAEPVFTSFSLFSFLSHDANFNLFSVPYNFINSFVLIFPDFNGYKSQLITQVSDMGYSFTSPLGATSFFVSLVGNFGVLGGCIAIFLFSVLVSKLARSNNLSLRFLFLMLCAIMPFMLFRDAFGIVTKVSLFSGFIVPVILLIFNKMTVFRACVRS